MCTISAAYIFVIKNAVGGLVMINGTRRQCPLQARCTPLPACVGVACPCVRATFQRAGRLSGTQPAIRRYFLSSSGAERKKA